MDLDKDAFLFLILKKKKEELTPSDLLILESDDQLRKHYERLLKIKEEDSFKTGYDEYRRGSQSPDRLVRKNAGRILVIPAAVISAAAVILIAFLFYIRLPGFSSQTMGGNFQLGLSSVSRPDSFITEGEWIDPSGIYRLSLTGYKKSFHQGGIFSIDSRKNVQIYLNFQDRQFPEYKRIIVPESVVIDPAAEKITFVVCVYENQMKLEEVINRVFKDNDLSKGKINKILKNIEYDDIMFNIKK
jgi:hypothetical protein